MMKLKKGVRLRGIRPEMAVGHAIVLDVFRDYGVPCVITSANDGEHGYGSLHFTGAALDYRTKIVLGPTRQADIGKLIGNVKVALGEDFDVVLEDLNGDNEHMHVEYQPKKA